MKNTPKNNDHEHTNKGLKKNNEQTKDYAHYPPAPAEQVKPHAHKNHSTDKEKEANNIAPPAPEASVTAKDTEKALNGSRKIVNEVDERYSDGSGGGFEATEQVNE